MWGCDAKFTKFHRVLSYLHHLNPKISGDRASPVDAVDSWRSHKIQQTDLPPSSTSSLPLLLLLLHLLLLLLLLLHLLWVHPSTPSCISLSEKFEQENAWRHKSKVFAFSAWICCQLWWMLITGESRCLPFSTDWISWQKMPIIQRLIFVAEPASLFTLFFFFFFWWWLDTFRWSQSWKE